MAIDDIVRRITEDAANEGASLIAAAEQDAARARDEATATSDAHAAATIARARALASRDAETIVANARLTARDAMLAARLEVDADVLVQAEAALHALSDAEYAAFIARGVASAAAGGETIRIGEADAVRLGAELASALAAAGVSGVSLVEEAAEGPHGVSVDGDRVHVEVSPRAAIAERRAELLAIADRELFGREG